MNIIVDTGNQMEWSSNASYFYRLPYGYGGRTGICITRTIPNELGLGNQRDFHVVVVFDQCCILLRFWQPDDCICRAVEMDDDTGLE